MKTFTIRIVVLFFGISCNGFPSEHHDPSEAEFEEEFHVKHNSPEQEAEAAKQLAKAEFEIDYQNDLYEAGKTKRVTLRVNHHLFEVCREQALYIHAYSDFVGFHTYELEVINFGYILPMAKA